MTERHLEANGAAGKPGRVATTVRAFLVQVAVGVLVYGASQAAAFALWPDIWRGILHAVHAHGPPTALALILLPLLASGPAVVVAHEAGHLVGARLAGMRPVMLGLGPIVLTRRSGRLRVGPNRFTPSTSGFAASLPDVRRDDLRWRHGVGVLAGPLANLLLAGACFACVPALADPWPYVAYHAWMAGTLSTAMGIINLVPMGRRSITTDGTRLLVLARGGPVSHRIAAESALASADAAGIRPADWPTSWQEALDAGLDLATVPDDERWNTIWLRVPARLDTGRTHDAERLLDLLADHDLLPHLERNRCLTSCFLAARRGDPLAARAHLDAAPDALRIPWGLEAAAAAALALAEGRAEEGRRLAAGALADDRALLGQELVWRHILGELAEGVLPIGGAVERRGDGVAAGLA